MTASRTGQNQTGWTSSTRFAMIDAAAAKALREKRNSSNVTILGAMYASEAGVGAAAFSHDCPGKLFVDYYTGEDGHVYVGVSAWYECDSTLEILGEVQIP
ncbi:hypothetical protein [Actinocrispum wychmicini]|uniref:Uncharacterized protein n=1 Tax=Actinocrispum wychmicini TaxID=1213861 RepID=A0A4R2J6W8_9PSEU|nr:hypothetical protein [Actinocrispum wychmicini]TCO54803.1 hypothetical protein EV192_10891 [Actinocrispum wychmicini]